MAPQAENGAKGDRIDLEELRYISLLQDLTGAMVYRALHDEEGNRIIYLVDKNDVGKAIGKDGRNVKRARLVLNKLYNVDKVVIK